MAISNATRLADFGTGIGTAGAIIQVDNANARIGLGTTNPNSTVTVGPVGASGTSLFVHGDTKITGVITASSFVGSGADLTNLQTDSLCLQNSEFTSISTAANVGVGTTRADSLARVNNTKILNAGIVTTYQVYTGDAATIGGKLSVSGITSVGDVVSSGIITADSYYGDAANMTNAGISAGKAMGLAAFLS